MMNEDVLAVLGRTDIYLVDQIMKGRYQKGDVLLDAGCGGGRNLHWFLRNGFEIYGIDTDAEKIQSLKELLPDLPSARFQTCPVERTNFASGFFDGIICSAVLHFARDEAHFFAMMDEQYHLLKKGGSFFIRMASDIGIKNQVRPVGNGVYQTPDGSTWFLLTRPLLDQVMEKYSFSFLEEFKTVNVNDLRCMSTLVLKKD